MKSVLTELMIGISLEQMSFGSKSLLVSPDLKKKTTNQQAPEGLCASLDHDLLFSEICFICTLPSLFVVKTALYFAHVQISEHFLEKDVWEPYWVYCSVTLNVVSDYSILYLRHNELNKKNI